MRLSWAVASPIVAGKPVQASNPTTLERATLAGALAVVFGYLLVSALEPLRLNWGDPWSDANVLTALNYSSKYGFIKTSFTDVLDIGPLTHESYRYTHYPPFAEILYGCVRKLAGGKPLDISVYRFFAIGFAGLGLNGLFRFVSGVWGKTLASWATAFCATNLLWLQFADSMHQSPILFASGMTALAAVPGWVKGPRRWHLLAIAASTYVCFLTAYDYYFFLPTVALLTARVLGVPLLSKKMIKLAALVAVSGALAIATKSAFVSGALGWHGFLEDVHFQFLERATTKFSPDYRSGFAIIMAMRWNSYFTPLPFVLALVLTFLALGRVRARGIKATVRSVFFGAEELSGHPASILILLIGALPFILVFSELSVEQVLPSQIMVPFYAVSCAVCVVWLGERKRTFALAAFAAVLAWQGFHFARIPKAFMDRQVTAQIADYLKANDSGDFIVTNLMSDGPVQYFFDRHLLPPMDVVDHTPESYTELASKTKLGVFHAVYFEDPNGRLIDKSLWSLLPQRSRWAVIGAPFLLRGAALDVITDGDARVLEGLRRSGPEVLHLPGVRIFRIQVDVDIEAKQVRNAKLLSEPTRYIDFGKKEAEVHKVSGFRFAENYPDVPGFCWTVNRSMQRTVLTKRGLTFLNDGMPAFESRLLLRFAQAQDEKVSLITWGSVNDQTLSATIDGVTVLPSYHMGPGQTRSELSFVVPKAVQQGDPIKTVIFKFRDVAEWGGGAAFGIMRIEPMTTP